jgi:hypothetical protein
MPGVSDQLRVPHGRRELLWAFLTILAASLVYLAVVIARRSIPGAGELFGHLIGVVGFVLMLMTEILYSLRKRSRAARWGRMSAWLKFHIYTGIVGPYLVLLHTSWKFNGLAGISMLLTVVIVASGFIGRYIYTAVPRSLDGTAPDADDLNRRMAAVEAELQRFINQQPEAAAPLGRLLAQPGLPAGAGGSSLVFGRLLDDANYWRLWQREKRRLPASARASLTQIERLQTERRTLQRQVASLVTVRRLLGVWQSIHIPIGVALFTAAFIHAGVALYYATLLK